MNEEKAKKITSIYNWTRLIIIIAFLGLLYFGLAK